MDIPLLPSEITPDWLTTALRSNERFGDVEVASIAIQDIGAGTGIFGEIGLLSVNYVVQGEAPDSLVIKMPCVEPENLAVAHALGIYQRELNFFSHIAPSASLRVPDCYYSYIDSAGRFVLLLENLSVDYVVGDQVVGATDEQVINAVETLAQFHIDWWEKEDLSSLSWLPVPDDPAYMAAVPNIYRTGLPVLIQDWSDRVPAESIMIAQEIEPHFENLMLMFAGGPHTFSHADTRLDNLFFARDKSSDVAFIDFQLCLKARGVNDIAYLVGNSVPKELAAEHWERYLRKWLDLIQAAGILYSWEDAISHYRQAVLYYTVGAMSLIGSFDTGNERGAAMAEAYVTRIFNHVVDIDAGRVFR